MGYFLIFDPDQHFGVDLHKIGERTAGVRILAMTILLSHPAYINCFLVDPLFAATEKEGEAYHIFYKTNLHKSLIT